MKKNACVLMLMSFFFLGLTSCASFIVPENEDELSTIERVIEVPEHSQDELYVMTHAWLSEEFRSSGSVINFRDRDSGKIVGDYTYTYYKLTTPYKTNQTLNISTRDNQIKIKLANPMYTYREDVVYGIETWSSPRPVRSAGDLETLRAQWNKFIDGLETFIESETNW